MDVSRKSAYKTVLIVFVLLCAAVSVYLITKIAHQIRRRSVVDVAPNMFELRREEALFSEAEHESLWLDPHQQRRYRPNARLEATVRGKHLVVQINDRGWRSDPVAVPKPDDVYRIACIGGSTTVEGWTNQTTYPALLQQELRKHFHRIEVVNCGVSGIGSRVEFELLDDVLAIQPDMIIRYNAVNDLTEIVNQGLATDLELSLTTRVFSNLQKIVSRCKEANVHLVFCTFCAPTIEQMSMKELEFFDFRVDLLWTVGGYKTRDYCSLVNTYNEKLVDFCGERHLPCLPVAMRLGGSLETFVDTCHMTPNGIARKASIIAEELVDRYDFDTLIKQRVTMQSVSTPSPE